MRENAEKLWRLFPWLWMLLGTIYDIWYQLVPGKWILDSDMAAEMVLSNHLNETHRIISTDWFYSRELRVLESQWFYRIGLLLSPNNWHMARVIAAMLLYAVFILAILFFAKSIGMGKYAPWLGAILMWPFGRWYLVYALYGTYYLIYMIFSMVVTGILLQLCRLGTETVVKHRRIKMVLYFAAGGLLSFGSGLNGVKQTMVYFGPLFFSVLVILFWAGWKKESATLSQLWEDCRAECLLWINGVAYTILNVAGYFVNLKVLSKFYSFDSYGYMAFQEDRLYRVYDILLDFLELFGYQGNVSVISHGGIAAGLGILFAGIFCVCLVRLVVRLRDLPLGAQMILWVFIFALIFNSMIFCMVGDGKFGYYKVYYWLPLIPFAISIIALELKTEKFPMVYFRDFAFMMIAVGLPVLSVGAVNQELQDPLFTTGGYRELTSYLLENGYTQGFASFWNSEVLREMSNNQIDTWTLCNVDNNFVIYGWLQEKEKKEILPEGRCFLIINEELDRRAEDSAYVKYELGELIYEAEPFVVYSFESWQRMMQSIDELQKNL